MPRVHYVTPDGDPASVWGDHLYVSDHWAYIPEKDYLFSQSNVVFIEQATPETVSQLRFPLPAGGGD